MVFSIRTGKKSVNSGKLGIASEEIASTSDVSDSSSERENEPRCWATTVDGKWAWMVCVASFLIIMFVDGISFTYGVMSEELIEYFHLEDNVAKASLPGAVLQGVYLMAGPLGSLLSIRYGNRIVAVVGSLLASVGFLTASFCPSIELVTVTYGAIAGLGFSFLFLTSMVATTLYFDRWRPVAVGLASCGSGVGIFIYPLMARSILDSLSWQWCLRIQSFMLLFCVIFALTFRPVSTDEKISKTTMKGAVASTFKMSLLKNPVFVVLLMMACTSTIGILIPFNYIPLTARERNMTEDQSAWLVSIMGATNTAGRALVGVAVYKAPVNPILFLVVGHGMGAVATFLSVLCNTFTTLAVYCGFFGLVFAIDAALSTVILARTIGVENLSGAFGLICLSRGVTGIIVTPTAGALHDITGDYKATFYLAASALTLTAILGVVAWILSRNHEAKSSYIITHLETSSHTGSVTHLETSSHTGSVTSIQDKIQISTQPEVVISHVTITGHKPC